DDETWWKAASVPLAELRLPAWHLSGWYDLFCEGTLNSYTAMAGHDVRQRLVVGPWAHINLYQQLVGEVDFGPAAHGLSQGLPGQMQAFLRNALDGEPVQTGVCVFVMGENAWRELPSWPPPSSPYQPGLGSETLRWQNDPADPVPTYGGRTLLAALPVPGPIDQRPVHERDDVVVWTSEPLTEDLTVIGTVTAQLALTCSAQQADVCVTLCDVHPDGRVLNVVDGNLRTTGAADRPRLIDVRVGSTAMTFRAGHRIALAVSASSWPRFDLSPAADYALDLGQSSLTLPVPEGP
ncbi:MAG: CocE/NonD family hydrolase, partial [Actinomycetota bacterium]|nr:CocE/NonD family hydrolase [Actinomycetota bacterium]